MKGKREKSIKLLNITCEMMFSNCSRAKKAKTFWSAKTNFSEKKIRHFFLIFSLFSCFVENVSKMSQKCLRRLNNFLFWWHYTFFLFLFFFRKKSQKTKGRRTRERDEKSRSGKQKVEGRLPASW